MNFSKTKDPVTTSSSKDFYLLTTLSALCRSIGFPVGEKVKYGNTNTVFEVGKPSIFDKYLSTAFYIEGCDGIEIIKQFASIKNLPISLWKEVEDNFKSLVKKPMDLRGESLKDGDDFTFIKYVEDKEIIFFENVGFFYAPPLKLVGNVEINTPHYPSLHDGVFEGKGTFTVEVEGVKVIEEEALITDGIAYSSAFLREDKRPLRSLKDFFENGYYSYGGEKKLQVKICKPETPKAWSLDGLDKFIKVVKSRFPAPKAPEYNNDKLDKLSDLSNFDFFKHIWIWQYETSPATKGDPWPSYLNDIREVEWDIEGDLKFIGRVQLRAVKCDSYGEHGGVSWETMTYDGMGYVLGVEDGVLKKLKVKIRENAWVPLGFKDFYCIWKGSDKREGHCSRKIESYWTVDKTGTLILQKNQEGVTLTEIPITEVEDKDFGCIEGWVIKQQRITPHSKDVGFPDEDLPVPYLIKQA